MNKTKFLIAIILILGLIVVSPLNPLLYKEYRGFAAKVKHYLFTNDKISPNKKDYEGASGYYHLWMHFRGRDFITKIMSEVDYIVSKIGEKPKRKRFKQNLKIIADKSDRRLYLYEGEKLLKNYEIACGKIAGNRIRDGDSRTPEGVFKVVGKRIGKIGKGPRKKKSKIILFNNLFYPNVVIHETSFRNLMPTEGCITLRKKDLDELFETIPIGTKIVIRP